MAEKEFMGYAKYYTGSCLVKFERDQMGTTYLTEIRVHNGRAFLITLKNEGTVDEVVEQHELGIVDTKPLDLNIGIYGERKEE